jgi:hypothetical protein
MGNVAFYFAKANCCHGGCDIGPAGWSHSFREICQGSVDFGKVNGTLFQGNRAFYLGCFLCTAATSRCTSVTADERATPPSPQISAAFRCQAAQGIPDRKHLFLGARQFRFLGVITEGKEGHVHVLGSGDDDSKALAQQGESKVDGRILHPTAFCTLDDCQSCVRGNRSLTFGTHFRRRLSLYDSMNSHSRYQLLNAQPHSEDRGFLLS